MIDPRLFTVERLLEALLYDCAGNVDAWRKHAEIVPDYMPPFPGPHTQPSVVVRFVIPREDVWFLRHSAGPVQGHFWDIYGDDYGTSEYALLALCTAPPPACIVRRFPPPGGALERK